jgi:NADPH:quinone reductase-like Zn-dependent oxidoreductase
MKAAVNLSYGPPEAVIEVRDVPKPTPKSDEVLIKLHASSVNRTDCGFARGKPFVTRFFSGLLRPRNVILGCELSGEVAAIGEDVTGFNIGDRVFGYDDVGWGGHAEYACVPQGRSITTIPDGTTYSQAAASSEGAHYALNYVRSMDAQPGLRVLVNGATGAIGSAAVQLLKQSGVYVVATSTTKDLDLVMGLGPDKVVNWQKQDFTKIDEQFDVVLDAVGKSSYNACLPILNPGGLYISTELGYLSQNLWLALLSPLFKLVRAKRVIFPIPKNNKEIIEFIRDRLAAGEFKPAIDRTFALDDIVAAYKYVESGQKTGNVVIEII